MYITFWKLQINEIFVFICLVKVIVIFGIKLIFSSVVLSVFNDILSNAFGETVNFRYLRHTHWVLS